MLTAAEKGLLGAIDHGRVWKDVETIASFDRRSGREGEAKAAEFVADRLSRAGVKWTLHRYPAWLSDPVSARLTLLDADGSERRLPCKTWSFCASTREPVRGTPVFVEKTELLHNPLDLLAARGAPRERDLLGKIVVARTASPVAVMDAQDRGAAALVCVWEQGDETLIHEGNVNFIWGQPDPWESSLYPALPVAVMPRGAGEALIRRACAGDAVLELETRVENGVREIPVLEADLPGESEEYVLLGNHLDSWHYGACDNATGNAVALAMAGLFAARPLARGIKICWWSGHSNGRYAGSSAFAADNFDSLRRRCLALCNADMPGLRGADDFARGSSGPDLRGLYASVVADVTGQKLRPGGFVTGWDLSFKNIGVSSCMSWSSTLPDGSPDGTANGFMSWWWHTEEDVMEHVDPVVMKQDARLYALALSRLASPKRFPFDVPALTAALERELPRYEDTEDLRARLKGLPLPRMEPLRATRLLNRALYAFKDAPQQDWALPLDWLPGLALARDASPRTERARLMIRSFRRAQLNRLGDLICALESLAS
ncbi:M28 family peptidase [Pyramidobacter sp. YE332]|uniref:M28 family metallopeptidase n=1 Tax=Pyramidobacter sp. YE332 TaxID=3068894 RepID=UPI00294B6FA2|nr:M28 family peptidase [Pyramidobacter sp. YE332]WOL39348.1 M28 family peptidase [Pyramidobacter sp. YE332]